MQTHTQFTGLMHVCSKYKDIHEYIDIIIYFNLLALHTGKLV